MSLRSQYAFCLAGGILAVGMAASASAQLTAPDDALDFFEEKVRPILAHNCFECHGPKKQKGGLRLDSAGALREGGEIGPAVVPGHPEESLLVQAVRYTDEDFQMPPKKRLSAEDVAVLEEWVKRGVPWPGAEAGNEVAAKYAGAARGEMEFSERQLSHWALQPLKKPPVPQPANTGWARTDIDRFILHKLEEAELAPSPPAEPATLLRRLSFDLIGLPPTPEENDVFTGLAQRDFATAVQRATERLLSSPHFGERYGRRWLDVARYADTNGSEVDHAMANAWRYRDYVVRAFNADLPFNEFIREQLAGDLLPGSTPDQLTGTGFLMLGPKAVADLDKPKLAADIVDEQIDTVSRAFMGLTVSCARCHDHKFDPIGDEDYYSLAGIFTSTRSVVDMTKRVVTWTERPLGPPEEGARIEALLLEIGNLKEKREMLAGAVQKPTPKLLPEQKFLLIEAEDFKKANVLVDADDLGKAIGVLRTRMEYPDLVEYEFELPEAGDYQLELRYAAKESRPVNLSINGNLESMSAASEVTGNWNPDAQRWFVQGVYRFRAGINSLKMERDGPVPLLDKLIVGRVSDQPHSRGVAPTPIVAKNESTGLDQEKARISARISGLQRELETIPSVLAPYEGQIADAPLLVRGSPSSPGAVVPRGFLRVVSAVDTPKPNTSSSGRLELAAWLTHPAHPLTARVIVNRVWLWHFGEGLVRSPDNFGLRGESPSHPELLDWLAVWFMEHNWSLKKLSALICNSAVYAQASSVEVNDRDPENRLLAHFPRRRLDAEALRDSMLAVSQELDPTLGGSLMEVMNRTYANGGDAPPDIVAKLNYDRPRRSIYLPIVRNALHDFFAIFDYPDPGMLTGQRALTTVAPQALFLMNSPFVHERARRFAQRVQSLAVDDTERIRKAYTIAMARPPSAQEMRVTLAFLKQESVELEGDPAVAQAAAWNRVCHTLLASNEFLYLR